MVFFTCNSCGESLKKAQVQNHSFKCRGCQYMTCADCSKDFWGNDYAKHTLCMTEDQKYGGTNYVDKPMKGQQKQGDWLKKIQEGMAATKNMNPRVKNLIGHLHSLENVPRKKAKFMNMMRSQRHGDNKLNEEVWKFLESIQKKSTENETPENRKENVDVGTADTKGILAENEVEQPRKSKRERKEERQKKQGKPQKKGKRKRDDCEADDVEDGSQGPKKSKKKKKRIEEETNQENEEPEGEDSANQESFTEEHSGKSKAFKWKVAISTVLQDAPEEGMKLKKLKRKVLALYLESIESNPHRKSELEIEVLISKKLQMRNDKYVMLKDRVKLKSNS